MLCDACSRRLPREEVGTPLGRGVAWCRFAWFVVVEMDFQYLVAFKEDEIEWQISK